jgi:hypothetical protein
LPKAYDETLFINTPDGSMPAGNCLTREKLRPEKGGEA